MTSCHRYSTRTGSSHYDCKSAYQQCYWESEEQAFEKCSEWKDCHALYCTDKHTSSSDDDDDYKYVTPPIHFVFGFHSRKGLGRTVHLSSVLLGSVAS